METTRETPAAMDEQDVARLGASPAVIPELKTVPNKIVMKMFYKFCSCCEVIKFFAFSLWPKFWEVCKNIFSTFCKICQRNAKQWKKIYRK
jgi:hypothetical protein